MRLSDTTELSISPVLTLFAAVLFGPLAGGIVGAASEIGDSELFQDKHGRSLHLKWLTYTSSRFMAGAAMGLTAGAVQDRIGGTAGPLCSDDRRIRGRRSARNCLCHRYESSTWQPNRHSSDGRPSDGNSYVRIRTSSRGPGIHVQRPLSLDGVPVPRACPRRAEAVQPLSGEGAVVRGATDSHADLQSANTALRDANLSFATALVQTLEESDRYTAGHSRAVATYSRDIAQKMGLAPEEQERAFLSGLVHDIGKIGLPATLLNKEGRLTLDELREMERHSEIGERILSKVEAYSDVSLIVRHHHERMDGEGYPDGIRGDGDPVDFADHRCR